MATRKANAADVYAGMKIRMGRQALGLTQAALGKKLGVTFQQIQKYEKGSNRVGASRLQALAVILKVPISFFFEDGPEAQASLLEAGNREERDVLIQFLASREGRQLNVAFQKIGDSRVRRRILEIVETLASRSSNPVKRPERKLT